VCEGDHIAPESRNWLAGLPGQHQDAQDAGDRQDGKQPAQLCDEQREVVLAEVLLAPGTVTEPVSLSLRKERKNGRKKEMKERKGNEMKEGRKSKEKKLKQEVLGKTNLPTFPT
jgi:hypothetical protein